MECNPNQDSGRIGDLSYRGSWRNPGPDAFFEGNSQVLAPESVSGEQKLFTILESREMSKMTASARR
jgi:hypothetical protein